MPGAVARSPGRLKPHRTRPDSVAELVKAKRVDPADASARISPAP